MKIPEEIAYQEHVTPTEKILYWAIKENKEGGVCLLSDEEISNITFIPERTIFDFLLLLQQKGYIRVRKENNVRKISLSRSYRTAKRETSFSRLYHYLSWLFIRTVALQRGVLDGDKALFLASKILNFVRITHTNYSSEIIPHNLSIKQEEELEKQCDKIHRAWVRAGMPGHNQGSNVQKTTYNFIKQQILKTSYREVRNTVLKYIDLFNSDETFLENRPPYRISLNVFFTGYTEHIKKTFTKKDHELLAGVKSWFYICLAPLEELEERFSKKVIDPNAELTEEVKRMWIARLIRTASRKDEIARWKKDELLIREREQLVRISKNLCQFWENHRNSFVKVYTRRDPKAKPEHLLDLFQKFIESRKSVRFHYLTSPTFFEVDFYNYLEENDYIVQKGGSSRRSSNYELFDETTEKNPF